MACGRGGALDASGARRGAAAAAAARLAAPRRHFREDEPQPESCWRLYLNLSLAQQTIRFMWTPNFVFDTFTRIFQHANFLGPLI